MKLPWGLITIVLILSACTQPQTLSPPTADEKTSMINTITIDTTRRHLGDNRMPESRSPEWAPVRDPEAPFFETTFQAPAGISRATLKINTFGSESEANPLFLNGKQVGGLCVAFDKDGWNACEIPLPPGDLQQTNTLRIDTSGSDRDDIMIEGVYFLYE